MAPGTASRDADPTVSPMPPAMASASEIASAFVQVFMSVPAAWIFQMSRRIGRALHVPHSRTSRRFHPWRSAPDASPKKARVERRQAPPHPRYPRQHRSHRLPWQLSLHRLHIDRDPDVVAHENAARLERLVPGEAELAAVDRGRGAERQSLTAPRVASATFVGRLENDFPRDVPDRQLSDEAVSVTLDPLDTRAPKRDGRVLLDLEEICRAQVGVTLLLSRVDAGGGDLRLDGRSGDVVSIEGERPAHIAEATADGRDHQVLHREANLGMGRVDGPGGLGRRRRFASECGGHDVTPCGSVVYGLV